MPYYRAIVVLSAFAAAAAFPKVDAHPLIWVALAPLFVVLERVPASAFGVGFAFGFVFRAATMYWVTFTVIENGGVATPIAVIVCALLVAYLAAYWALFAMIAARVGLANVRDAALLAVLWTGLEYFQTWFLTGFPWALIGYAGAATLPMAQVADLAGVYGLTFVVVFANALVALAWTRWRRASDAAGAGRAVAWLAGLVIAIAGYGAIRLAGAPPVDAVAVDAMEVALIQGNVAQRDKWDPGMREDIVQRHVAASERAIAAGAEIVIWPESSWPDPYGVARDPFAGPLLQRTADRGAALLVGTVHVEAAASDDGLAVTNSALMLAPERRTAARYDKVHLVPFGEYLPLQRFLRVLGPMVQAVGTLRPGAADQDLLAVRDRGIAPLGLSICYEIIFPAMARDHVRRGAEWLVTITNDAWYGTTSGPYQHFAMARLRAVENRRWLARAANTGISGFVDPWGRVVEASSLETEATITSRVVPRDDLTIYVRTGDLFAQLCMAVALLGAIGWFRPRWDLLSANRPS